MRSIYLTSFILFFAIESNGQIFTKFAVKAGNSISGQQITPKQFGDGGLLAGISFGIEPTLVTFGNKKQFDLNTDISFIQKGGAVHIPIYVYDDFGQLIGTGSESYSVRINYLSVSPTFKANLGKIFFVKAGPRMDVFSCFHSNEHADYDRRTNKDFNSLNFGVTYGAGICTGTKRTKFICEFVGQQDFNNSTYNKASRQTYRNYSFLLNAGVSFVFSKEE